MLVFFPVYNIAPILSKFYPNLDMDNVLKLIRYEVTEDNYAVNKRDIHNMINEWRAHNLLYSLGIMKDRTKSVDLNINQSWYVTLSYKVLSLFYFHFN